MTQKQTAQHFLLLCAKGESQKAFELYAAKDFRHHNSYFKGDGPSLMKAMEEEAKRNPAKIFEVQRALEDDDLVAVHSHIQEDKEDAGVAVVHLFRFEKGKIVELWDVGQAVPPDMINENGIF